METKVEIKKISDGIQMENRKPGPAPKPEKAERALMEMMEEANGTVRTVAYEPTLPQSRLF